MKATEILPGSKVDIRIVQLMEKQANDPNAENAIFYTTVHDVYEDGTVEINIPTENGKLQMLPKKIRYEFLFTMNKGIYKAEGTILEHIKKGNFYLFKIELTSALKKVQRREYYRLECLMPMMFLGLDEKAVEYKTIDEVKNYMNAFADFKVRGIGTILDISGGGARFVTTNSLKDITYILLQFHIEQEGSATEVEVVSKVIRTEQMPDDNKYVHRVKFYFKNEHVKEKIISYIFEEERKIRKKEQGI